MYFNVRDLGKEIRFILIFSAILSLIQFLPTFLYYPISQPKQYWVITIVLSANIATLFILAFSEEYKSRVAFFMLAIAVIFYLFILPYSYARWIYIAILFVILEALFVCAILFFIALDFIANVFDKDISLIEKADKMLFTKMNAFYNLISGGFNAKKLPKNNS